MAPSHQGLSPRHLLVLLLLTATAPAAAPPPLSPAQQVRQAERDRLVRRANELFRQGKTGEWLVTIQQAFAVERELFGHLRPASVGAVEAVAAAQENQGRFTDAVATHQEIVALRRLMHGEGHWRVTDARIALADCRLLARMTPEDRDRLGQAERDNTAAVRLITGGKAKEAGPLVERVLATRRELLGDAHRLTGMAWFNLGSYCWNTGRHDEAARHVRRTERIYREALGERHPDFARVLNQQAVQEQSAGRHVVARPLLERAVGILRKALGEDDPDYPVCLINLAELYRTTGEPGRARPLLEKAVALIKATRTAKHPFYAAALRNLASTYREMGDSARARPLYEEALAVFNATLGPGHRYTQLTQRELAGVYRAWGDYQRGLPLLERMRDAQKRTHGEKHPGYANALFDLSIAYREMGDYARGLPLVEKGLGILEAAHGKKHPGYGFGLNTLATLHHARGEYTRARQLYEQARDLFAVADGERLNYAVLLSNLATLHGDNGDHEQALKLYLKARDVFRAAAGEKHPRYAGMLNSLAHGYQALGQPEKARPLFEQSLALRKATVGEAHPDYALTLTNLAGVLDDQGDRAGAMKMHEQARDIRRKTLGEKHPHYAVTLFNLASLHRDAGDRKRARELLTQARNVYREAMGEQHPRYTVALDALAGLAVDEGRPEQAIPLYRQAIEAQRRHLDATFSALSDRQRLGLLATMRHSLNSYLGVTRDRPDLTRAVYQEVLTWKGQVTARQAEERLARDQPGLATLFDSLRTARAGLARLTAQAPSPDGREAWLKRFAELEQVKEDLEVKLANASAAFARLRRADLAALARDLPEGSALVELLGYDDRAARSEPRLVAFVLRRGGKPVRVELGALGPITRAVAAWRQPLERDTPGAIDRKAADTLRERLWLPLRKALGEARTVLIAPDGVLCGLPFAALPGEKPGSYLIEEVAIGYVPSGRQLLEGRHPDRKAAGLLVVGGLEYGPGDGSWEALPGARLEASRITTTYREAFPRGAAPRELTGKGGGRADLLAALSGKEGVPRWLHLATHGYFAPPEPAGPVPRRDGEFARQRAVLTFGRNPLLLSGLVLAGANGDPSGVLTAEEVSALDLRGCELVTLSACQTGLGKVAGGEGLLGLQRAFHLAGARSVVCSQWSVSDPATSVLMEQFYRRLWADRPVSRLEALRQAQLFVLKRPDAVIARAAELRAKAGGAMALRGVGKKAILLPEGDRPEASRSHPAWWAGFVLSGDVGR